jgi:hypothetical protein
MHAQSTAAASKSANQSRRDGGAVTRGKPPTTGREYPAARKREVGNTSEGRSHGRDRTAHSVVKPLWTGTYDNFGRENVVKLSRLIAQYLENKPSAIDANRIYSCVESCYRDFHQGFSDNPEHYYLDVRMLVSTCSASSSWFSTNQYSQIESWMDESGWD